MSCTTSAGKNQTNWKIAVLFFFLGWIFIYADRMILNPVQTLIRSEFQLTNAEVGLISSIFFLTYTFMQVPSGMLGDKFGKTKVIALGFAIFGLFTGITGIAGSFGVLLVARALMGIGQGFYYGPQYGLSSELIPTKYRTLGSAIINSGQAFGITLGLVASSWIAVDLNGGWRMPFYVFAVPTLLVGLAILVFIRTPKSAPAVAQHQEKPKFMDLLKNKNLVLTYLLVFCSLYGFFVMCTWLPVYLEEVRQISRSDTGFVSSLVAWTSIPAALLYGYISDKIGKRRPVILCLLPLAACSIALLLLTESRTLMIVALVCYGFFGKLATDPLAIALIADNTPRNQLSTAFGIFNFVGMSSAIVAPYATGLLRDITGSWNSGFYVAVALLLTGIVVVLCIDERKRIS